MIVATEFRYVIVSPVRDEAGRVERTIDSIIRQTVRPLQWVLVDDGSTDGTDAIVDQAAREHSWITVVHRTNRGRRASGAGVVAAFRDGYAALRNVDWAFLVKLDGDLVLPPRYFEQCLREFEGDPRLGIGGGTVYHEEAGHDVVETAPRFHVRGASKIYRRSCWEALGGLVEAPGWDTLDEVRAQMLGWTTRTFAEVKALHLRPTGMADGHWATAVKYGLANYVTGYHPVFMLLKVTKRVTDQPHGIMAAGLLWGFISGYLRGVPRGADATLVRFVRQQQLRRLLGQPSIWR
jgi:glycosyltransferase involved in cell wall biosynthesis